MIPKLLMSRALLDMANMKPDIIAFKHTFSMSHLNIGREGYIPVIHVVLLFIPVV